MKVAIIGSNGFIGRALTTKLSGINNLQLSLYGRAATSAFDNKFQYHQILLNNKEFVLKHFQNIDLVYYLVSETIPASSWENPLIELEKNLQPFITFHENICQSGVKRVVFVSSAGTIYGPSSEKVSESADKHPFSPYGITKLCMENYLSYFEKRFGLLHDIYRVSNVYGEGQDTSKGLGIINTFIENIIHKGSINVFGDGKITRNYIHVNDVAEYMSLSAYKLNSPSCIYNLSSDDTLTINDLVAILKKVIPEKFEINFINGRQSDNAAIVPDNALIKAAYPDHKPLTIEEGIRFTYKAIKNSTLKKHV